MIRPITPDEVGAAKAGTLPDAVVECWNQIIAAKYNNGQARITQDEVVTMLTSLMGVGRNFVFDNGWLNVESMYRHAGWKVVYDKPAYDETYKAYFIFSRK